MKDKQKLHTRNIFNIFFLEKDKVETEINE